MLSIRNFDPAIDYDDALRWWKHHGWAPLPVNRLPRFGMMIEDSGLKIACAWIYFSTDGVGWLEWMVANPEVPLRHKHQAIQLLLKRLIREAEGLGMHSLCAALKSRGLIRLYQKCGFSVGDTGLTTVVMTQEATTCQPEPECLSLVE